MNTSKLRCVVLEDEDDIRFWLVKKLGEFSELDIIGEATNLDDAYRLIATTKPDVAFMDVQLIGGDAFTLLSRLQNNGLPIPYIVMATGYPEYVLTALNDYRRYIVQYLTKPFIENWEVKFRKAIDALMAAKMKDLLELDKELRKINTSSIEPSHTFLQSKGSLFRLDYESIVYLEAAGGGESIIVLDNSHHQVDLTLNRFMQLLPDNFYRISKSNIVNTKRVFSISRGDRTVTILREPKNKELGISDNYYNAFLKQLPMAKNKLSGKSSNHKVKQSLGETKKSTAKEYEKVTVLYINISGFSKDNSTQEMDDCFNSFDQIITDYDLEKIDYVDSSYVCVSGLTKPKKDYTKKVIQAALEIKQLMIDREAASTNQSPLGIRIGVHTGAVLIKVEGNQKKSYEVRGAAIDTAKEIGKHGEIGDVNISTTSWKLIRKEFNCRFSGSVKTKNKEEIEIYAVSS